MKVSFLEQGRQFSHFLQEPWFTFKTAKVVHLTSDERMHPFKTIQTPLKCVLIPFWCWQSNRDQHLAVRVVGWDRTAANWLSSQRQGTTSFYRGAFLGVALWLWLNVWSVRGELCIFTEPAFACLHWIQLHFRLHFHLLGYDTSCCVSIWQMM